jgi:hypothetical protein
MCVPRLSASDQLTFERIERREQRHCAMALVIVRYGAGPVRRKRQPKLRTLQRLALAFFVAARYQRLRGRIEIEPDHIPEFFLEFWIV